MRIKKAHIFSFFLPIVALALSYCSDEPLPRHISAQQKDTVLYLNHCDTARYVGMQTCRLCHQSVYNTFIKTGMGKSFDVADRLKSAGSFSNARIYDSYTDFYYRALWKNDSLYMHEYRLSEKDTIHLRNEQVNYIVGSGQHTNSHLLISNGYLSQMPMTFYTQKKKWDLPPGFEGGVNTRFSRKIGLECMSCHNAYPGFVMGSENKYTMLPLGIDCERCHGPGSIHVAQRQSGSRIDTSRYIDYSIVNPAKLNIDAQFDICQRCHLQGNAILKEGVSFYDFKPGTRLSDYISVFLPRYKNADDEFIMASHADRLKQSACFIKSLKSTEGKNSLKPYKNALTCVTCHNPHVSVRETNHNVFNEVCTNCHKPHQKNSESSSCKRHFSKAANCVSCHMPASGSTDIPHVSVHDHYIRRPVSKKEKQKIKTFLGLYSVNEKNPDRLTRAKAYINQYEKFGQEKMYLDSAIKLLDGIKNLKNKAYVAATIQLLFVRQDFAGVTGLVNTLGEDICLQKHFVKQSYENFDAWTSYRIAESFYRRGDNQKAVTWFSHCTKLAPYYSEFRNKLATSLAAVGKPNEAIKELEFILKENPDFVGVYSNLGYLKLRDGMSAEALRLYKIGETLDPDNEALLLNLAGYYFFMNERANAQKYLKRILKKNPANTKAKEILQQLL